MMLSGYMCDDRFVNVNCLTFTHIPCVSMRVILSAKVLNKTEFYLKSSYIFKISTF